MFTRNYNTAINKLRGSQGYINSEITKKPFEHKFKVLGIASYLVKQWAMQGYPAYVRIGHSSECSPWLQWGLTNEECLAALQQLQVFNYVQYAQLADGSLMVCLLEGEFVAKPEVLEHEKV